MQLGRRVLGLAAVLAGVVGLAFGPAGHVPPPLAMFGDAVLILGGIGINLSGRIAVCAALALIGYFAVNLGLHIPKVAHAWKVWVAWQDLAETAAMAGGAAIAWAMLSKQATAARSGEFGRMLFGLCCLVFGISHFVYLKATAPLVPHWLPLSGVVWAYATGAAQIAAGLSVLTGVLRRLATMLLTVMYAGFGLLVWLPATMAAPRSHDAWSETAVNWLLTGAAWCVADWSRREN
jgi:uncharacterized membrane protein